MRTTGPEPAGGCATASGACLAEIAERLAGLTAQRDHDTLDSGLVSALMSCLSLSEVAVHRVVGEQAEQRWLTTARAAPGQPASVAATAWLDVDSLPLLDAEPLRRSCLDLRRAMLLPGAPSVALFPIGSADSALPTGVLEVAGAVSLTAEQSRLVTATLQVCCNLHGLLDYSERDSLTGLLNRKSFDENFLRLALPPPVAADDATSNAGGGLRRHAAAGSGWLAVIDIDHFKRVNDNHGHLIGDEVLLLLARLMQSTFRIRDRLYRFGGEEFVVLMRCADAADAAAAMERLRAAVEAYTFPQAGRITVSIGFTGVRSDDAPSAAFERADRAVYYAKQNGRNRVGHHESLVGSGALIESERSSEVELF
ncbi:MAG: GGDEF domain-containing protein [Rubrivivax sp.]